jgi:hypothetical protein
MRRIGETGKYYGLRMQVCPIHRLELPDQPLGDRNAPAPEPAATPRTTRAAAREATPFTQSIRLGRTG